MKLLITLALVGGVIQLVTPLPAPSLRSNQADKVSTTAEKVPDKEETELENLRKAESDPMTVAKEELMSVTTVNGETHAKMDEAVLKNGKLVAHVSKQEDVEAGKQPKMKTTVDVPAKGIHKTIVGSGQEEDVRGIQEPPRETKDGPMQNLAQYPSTQYSPMDLAEYVMRTGDEEGVTAVVEELVREGLMSRQEALSFVEEVKYDLRLLLEAEAKLLPPAQKLDLSSLRSIDFGAGRNEVKKSAENPVSNLNAFPAADYGDVNLTEQLNTEYGLAEVFYQLAKVMFTQIIGTGNVDMDEVMRRFAQFLKQEAEANRISRELEKKILDVLVASLLDTVGEHPELLLHELGPATSPVTHNSFINLPRPQDKNASKFTPTIVKKDGGKTPPKEKA